METHATIDILNPETSPNIVFHEFVVITNNVQYTIVSINTFLNPADTLVAISCRIMFTCLCMLACPNTILPTPKLAKLKTKTI